MGLMAVRDAGDKKKFPSISSLIMFTVNPCRLTRGTYSLTVSHYKTAIDQDYPTRNLARGLYQVDRNQVRKVISSRSDYSTLELKC